MEVVIGWEHDQGVRGEAQFIQRTSDREMRLVAGVDARALEVLSTRRRRQPAHPTEMQVARERHAHEVRHDAAARQQTEGPRPVADEVAQPADHLFLGERREGPGVPHIDALVRHLREQLAHDRHRQRRWREVAELPRVLGVHQAARQAGGELVDDVGGTHRLGWRSAGAIANAGWVGGVVAAPRLGVRRGVTHRALRCDPIQELQRLVPGPEPE